MGFRERSNPKVMREVEVNCTRTGLNYLTTWLEERISDWTRMKRIVGKIIEKACRKYLNIKDEITLTKSSPIYDLDLFLDDNGVLSVGSWLSGVDLNLT